MEKNKWFCIMLLSGIHYVVNLIKSEADRFEEGVDQNTEMSIKCLEVYSVMQNKEGHKSVTELNNIMMNEGGMNLCLKGDGVRMWSEVDTNHPEYHGFGNALMMARMQAEEPQKENQQEENPRA
jgi:hypothetical protein